MERTAFIKLLEEYRDRAIMELRKETKVQASLLLSDGFKSAVTELEGSCRMVNSGLQKVQQEFKNISADNKLPERYNSFCYNQASTEILSNVISSLAGRIRDTDPYKIKESEIRTKFDAAINTAKMSRSAARIKELADALGIETPSIEVTNKVTSAVDTEYVKEKIKAVLLLK